MPPKSKFPYQNTSLKNLPHEKWGDIPGFDGLYQISNYGRIKSLSREISMNTPHGGVYVSKEKIRKARLDVKRNTIVNDNLYTLIISLYRDGEQYHFSVPRLVYYVFVETFDLDDRTIYISYKDRDGRNANVSNLVKTTISIVKLHSYKIGRAISHLRVLRKPVTQFDMNGRPVRSYESMYEAGKANHIGERNIAEVASGKTRMYKGFFWKWGKHTRNLNLKKIERISERETIHSSLMKRLGIKRINRTNLPPFLNLSTETMKGERWKDVPGYEGLYKVSNLGRVKALRKVTEGIQRKWMPEQIQRVVVDFRNDKHGKEVPGSTFACMAKNGQKKLVSIPRLVYYLFVEKFDIKDSAWRVYYKDGNTLNVNAKNLFLKRGVFSINKNK